VLQQKCKTTKNRGWSKDEFSKLREREGQLKKMFFNENNKKVIFQSWGREEEGRQKT
jgi:hypothetical protein